MADITTINPDINLSVLAQAFTEAHNIHGLVTQLNKKNLDTTRVLQSMYRAIASALNNLSAEMGSSTPSSGGGGGSQQASGLAPLDSPNFINIPTAPTAPTGTNSQQLATTAYCIAEILAILAGQPAISDFTLAQHDHSAANKGGAVRFLKARGYRNAALTVNGWTKVPIDTVVAGYDPGGIVDTANGRITPGVAGFYQVNGQVSLQSLTGICIAGIYVSGSRTSTGSSMTASASVAKSIVYDLVLLGATDYVELWGNSGASVGLEVSQGSVENYLTITGPF